jgi:replicative DNA helicase
MTMATSSNENLRVPPQNLEAERSVLGALMLDKDAIINVANLIRQGDFYKDDHNMIFEAMIELYEKNEPIDVLSLSNRLEEKGQIEKIGGSSYLTSLVNSVPSSANIAHYAKVV